MNRYLLVFYFIFISSTIFCQQQSAVLDGKNSLPVHSFGDFSISGSPNILFNTPNGVQFAGGLKISAFVSKRISFDTDIVLGRDYFHAGPGIIGIPLWFSILGNYGIGFQNFGEILLYIVFITLSAEHISYHIPVKNMIDISPYISLLRYKYSYKYGDYQNWDFAGQQLSFAIGVQMNKYFNRFVLSPYAEVNVGYTDHIPGYNIGVYCGYYFMTRKMQRNKIE